MKSIPVDEQAKQPVLPSAHSIKDMDIRLVHRSPQTVEAFYVITTDKYIYMLADLALLIQNAVSQSSVPAPERIKHVSDR
jgi:hypothetical protein